MTGLALRAKLLATALVLSTSLSACGSSDDSTTVPAPDDLIPLEDLPEVIAEPEVLATASIKDRIIDGDTSVCADQPLIADMLRTKYMPSPAYVGGGSNEEERRQAIEASAPNISAVTLAAHDPNIHRIDCEAKADVGGLAYTIRYSLRPDLQSDNYAYEIVTERSFTNAWVRAAENQIKANAPPELSIPAPRAADEAAEDEPVILPPDPAIAG